MNQPYFLLMLLLVFAFGILFKWVWDKSYGYFKYTPERKPPATCLYCDCQKDNIYCDGECDIEHEVQMMKDAKEHTEGGESK